MSARVHGVREPGNNLDRRVHSQGIADVAGDAAAAQQGRGLHGAAAQEHGFRLDAQRPRNGVAALAGATCRPAAAGAGCGFEAGASRRPRAAAARRSGSWTGARPRPRCRGGGKTSGAPRATSSPAGVAPWWSLSEAAGAAPGNRDTETSRSQASKCGRRSASVRAADLELPPPQLQNLRGRPMIEAAVDLAAAAHATALDVGHLVSAHRDGLPAVAVFQQHLRSRERRAGFQSAKRALLNQEDITARLSQKAGGDGATRPGTDDRNGASQFPRRDRNDPLRLGRHARQRPGIALSRRPHPHSHRARQRRGSALSAFGLPAVKGEDGQALVVAHQVALKTKPGSFSRPLPGAGGWPEAGYETAVR